MRRGGRDGGEQKGEGLLRKVEEADRVGGEGGGEVRGGEGEEGFDCEAGADVVDCCGEVGVFVVVFDCLEGGG